MRTFAAKLVHRLISLWARSPRSVLLFLLACSAVAVADVALFQVLLSLRLSVRVSSVVSFLVSTCFIYRIAASYAAKQLTSAKSMILMFVVYTGSILAFSTMVGWLATHQQHAPLFWKLACEPFFLIASILVGFLLIAQFGTRAGPEAPSIQMDTPAGIRKADFSVVVAALLAALLSIVLFSLHPMVLSSDTLFLESLARDLVDNGGQWSQWKITPAPAFFPDMLLYLIGFKLLPDAAATITFVSVAQWALLGATIVWLGRVLFPRLRAPAISIIISTYALFTIVVSQANLWVFFNSTNNHFASLWLPLLALAIGLPYIEGHRSHRSALALGVLAFAGAISTANFLLAFTAPVAIVVFGVFAIARDRRWTIYRRRSVISAIAILAGTGAAAAASPFLIPNAPSAGRTLASPSRLFDSLKSFLDATTYVFSSNNALLTLTSVGVLACGLYLLYRLWRATTVGVNMHAADGTDSRLVTRWGNTRLASAALLAAVSLMILVLGSVVSGGFVDMYGYRYFAFPLTLIVLVALVAWASTSTANVRMMRIAGFGIAIAVALGTMAFAAPLVTNYSRESVDNSATGACIAKLRNDGVALTAGVADYWHARGLSLTVSPTVPITAVWNNLKPYFSASSAGPMIHPDRYPKYDFLVLNPMDAHDPFNFTQATIGTLVPTPTHKYSCGAGMSIWTWDGDGLNHIAQGAMTLWALQNGFKQSGSVPASLLPSQSGTTDGAGRSTGINTGVLLFGPYLTLDTGRYEVSINYTWQGDPAGLAHDTWRMGNFSGSPTHLLASGSFRPDLKAQVARFTVGPAGLAGFEVEVAGGGPGKLTVQSVTFEKLRK